MYWCTFALQSILDDVQRLVNSRGAVVIACHLAQIVLLSEISCMVSLCSPTAVYNRIHGDMRNWLATPPCIQKRKTYSASFQFGGKIPQNTHWERTTMQKFLAYQQRRALCHFGCTHLHNPRNEEQLAYMTKNSLNYYMTLMYDITDNLFAQLPNDFTRHIWNVTNSIEILLHHSTKYYHIHHLCACVGHTRGAQHLSKNSVRRCLFFGAIHLTPPHPLYIQLLAQAKTPGAGSKPHGGNACYHPIVPTVQDVSYDPTWNV